MTTDLAILRRPSKLAEALAKVQGELHSIPQTKTGKISGESKVTGKSFEYSYKYADLADVVAVAYPITSKYGLAFLARPTVNEQGQFVLAYSLMHESGEREDGEYPLPTNGTPQQLGAAITYARRYTYCSVIGVVSEEDVDGREQEVQTTSRPRQQRSRQDNGEPRQGPPVERTPEQQREDLRGYMGWRIKQLGLSAEDALKFASERAGREIKDSRELTLDELASINKDLEAELADRNGVDQQTGEVEMITGKTQRRQRALRDEVGLKDDGPFWEWLEVQFGRPFTSSKEQSEAEARTANDRLQIMADTAKAHESGNGGES